MKKTLLLFGLMISGVGYSQDMQQDSIVIEQTKKTDVFQYRIKFDNVTNSFAASSIEDQLKDIFHVTPKFHEEISQFIFISEISLEATELYPIFRETSYRVTYFQKVDIVNQID